MLYADDIVLLAENELHLQTMLNKVFEWCKKWKLCINEDKTNILHFRNSNVSLSNHTFTFGNLTLDYKCKYKYLGVYFNEFLNFKDTAQVLSDSAGRALGGVISKFQNTRDVGFNTFNCLYSACILPIMEYCSGVWGFQDFKSCDHIQNRAMRYYFGVHRSASIAAMRGDIGWIPLKYNRYLNIIHL